MRNYATDKCELFEDDSSSWLDPGIAILAPHMQHIALVGTTAHDDDST